MNYIKNVIKYIFKKNRTLMLVSSFIVFWVPVVLFSKIAGEILEKRPIGTDITIMNVIHDQATFLYDQIFIFITNLGSVWVILPVTLVVLAYLLYKKQHQNALILFSGVGGAAIANLVLKLIFHRDRPNLWHLVITETGYSFPSGHAMMSSALILSIVFIVWKTRWRWSALIVGSILIGAIGLSRIYLGVHYPTDVVAGWSISLVWVFIVSVSIKSLSSGLHPKITAKKISI